MKKKYLIAALCQTRANKSKYVSFSQFILLKPKIIKKELGQAYLECNWLNNNIRSIWKRYSLKKPLQYILGDQPFIGCNIKTKRPILIPRRETEAWVNDFILEKQGAFSVLDVGCGSGCIAIAIAKHCSKSTVTAIDINPQAISLTKLNARINSVKITVIKADALMLDLKADFIVCNPPYIPINSYKKLDQSTKRFEDKIALTDSKTGSTIARSLIMRNLNSELWIEVYGKKQALELRDFALFYGFKVRIRQDYCGIDRLVICSPSKEITTR